MVNKAIPSAHMYACFYSSVCCSLGSRFIKEAVLCVSTWIGINKFFGALIPREIHRCREFWSWHYRQAAWRPANILPVHLHSVVGLITAGVDSVVSVAEAPTTEWSRQQNSICCVQVTVKGEVEPLRLSLDLLWERSVYHLRWEAIDTESCTAPDRTDILSKAEWRKN